MQAFHAGGLKRGNCGIRGSAGLGQFGLLTAVPTLNPKSQPAFRLATNPLKLPIFESTST